ncbi:hypothetical protein GQ43DRAFT_440873 [Delitschia confertaspora ATCC 74209]|uniref:Metal cation transporter, ZIP family n=1 Tax=Delitschia confertaspora ATCC 74209 TaxID=1513339 RepID=A0A9P4MSM0_9PLEO|nr:hypothetical protein GQ43DRAFT_440873 [Delitschia confertaspora ATCC 74209]
MAATSGIACTVGASIICVDLIIRQLPGKKHFRIQDSNAFLSAGLSLSFGVMIFSSLYSMLPSARRYLEKGGLAPKPAVFTLTACFLAGALGIAILSRVLHRFIPHSIVDCSHDHGDEEEDMKHAEDHENHHHSDDDRSNHHYGNHSHEGYGTMSQGKNATSPMRRPSIKNLMSSGVTKLVKGYKEFCDEQGQCHGYSEPCGQECFKIVQLTRDGARPPSMFGKNAIRPSGLRSMTMPQERHQLLEDVDEYALLKPTKSLSPMLESASDYHSNLPTVHSQRRSRSSDTLATLETVSSHHSHHSHHSHASQTSHTHPTHHHHVPTNIFLSLSLQTSIAIALHKLPEGFITYATNHANPKLGFAVFLALFIHNITEGFAMALPLYLAFNSRWRAMSWSALLGGLTQPLGAGIAVLWFKVAGNKDEGEGPGENVYGIMFAVTAGIMTMVALQLFGESLELTHSRRLCFVFAFVGMGILGVSSGLTA